MFDGTQLVKELHIPADLVVTRRFSHHTLALAMGYPHHVSSAPTAICMEMRHGPDRQSDTQKPHSIAFSGTAVNPCRLS
jgi:hypothetical protein